MMSNPPAFLPSLCKKFSKLTAKQCSTSDVMADLNTFRFGLNGFCSTSQWCIVVKKLCDEGQLNEAIRAVDSMYQGGIILSTEILYYLLQGCINKKDLMSGRKVCCLITKCGFEENAFLGSHVIRMLTICSSLCEVIEVFNKIRDPSVFTWTALISAYNKLGQPSQAIKAYHSMQLSFVKLDQHVYVAVLRACANEADLSEAKLVHSDITVSGFEENVFVGNTLIDMYVKCHSLKDARKVFDNVPGADVVSWTAMIMGYAQHGQSQEATRLFQQMQWEGMIPNNVTYLSILKACSDAMAIGQGKQLHADIVKSELESDVTIGNMLVDMYAKCGRPEDACSVFNKLPKRDMVTWNALIAAYAQQGSGTEAFHYFHRLQEEGMKPDSVTFLSILKACSGIAALEQGKLIHAFITESGLGSDVFLGNTLIDMYAKCGCLRDAFRVFNKLPKRDVVTWNALITGYVQHRYGREALKLCQQMRHDGIEPDHLTFISTLKACSILTALDEGKLIHIHITENDFVSDMYVCSSLIDMYAKCQSLEDARSVFDQMPQQSVVVWNTLISGYAQHGQCQKCLQLFEQMQQKGLEADCATCISILKACSSLAALDQGRLFHAHITETGFDSIIGNVLIDMYAKCGSLEDAYGVFDKLENKDVVTWTTMIAGYGQCSNYKLALHYFENMQHQGLKPIDATYVCLLTACCHAGLVKEGCHHFDSMRDAHGIIPTAEHFYCMVDLFGRTGRLVEAEDLLQSMPFFGPHTVGLRTLLNHCRMHGDVNLGRRCFNCIVKQDPKDASTYTLMSVIYANACMLRVACEVEGLTPC